MLGDDDIVITSSHNLNEDSGIETLLPEEGEDASRRVLESQGIFLEQINPDIPLQSKMKLPQDFQDMAGIEIIPNEEKSSIG